MINLFKLLFICVFLHWSCTKLFKVEQTVTALALEEFLLNSTFYFPINNIGLLETVKKESVPDDCEIDADSLKRKFYVYDNYGSRNISDYKLRSIYLEILDSCFDENELSVYAIKTTAVSAWGKEMMQKYYGEMQIESLSKKVFVTSVDGLPYSIKYFESVDDLEKRDSARDRNTCIKYLKISPVFMCKDYFCIEITDGCQGMGEQHTLYVFRRYRNKMIIDNKLRTEYKF
jgi:hypothetical protein